ncbi:hypothetical protein FHS57_006075 [Runella defluvii]|uniref:Uncharacterized protein n=1 Tax=Runella defluvii TaxID=370973 RepID=A0A7W5ZSE4_9BACT|nr:hypothetical protein [Runella defluvii]MBB3842046.1 hypothetical protein [Runella defluvii]
MREHIRRIDNWVRENHKNFESMYEIDFLSYPHWEEVIESIKYATELKPIRAWATEEKLDFLYILAREELGFLTCFLYSKSDTFSKHINLTIDDIEDLLKTCESYWNEKHYQGSFPKLVELLRKGKIVSKIANELLVLIELYHINTLGYGKRVSFDILLSWNYIFYEKYIDQILIEEANDFDYCLCILYQYENNTSRIEKYMITNEMEEIKQSKGWKKLLKKFLYLQSKENQK